jgi:hypothetical protein
VEDGGRITPSDVLPLAGTFFNGVAHLIRGLDGSFSVIDDDAMSIACKTRHCPWDRRKTKKVS